MIEPLPEVVALAVMIMSLTAIGLMLLASALFAWLIVR
jgi:hypothetical protein